MCVYVFFCIRAAAPGQVVPAGSSWFRVVAHIDLDCFYAQVEMISHPELKDKPLGNYGH